MMSPEEFAKAKFWSRVEIPLGRWWPQQCWVWTGAMTTDKREPGTARGWGGGYGCLKVDGQWVRAHVYALELCGQTIPPGQVVRHSCDNRLCVNPTHLEPGTPSDNLRDAWERGRR